MRPSHEEMRLREMLDTARAALELTHGRSRSDLETDHGLRMALLWAITEVGEGSKQVSDATRANAQDVPWSLMAKSRDRIIHGYLTIDLDIVWDIVTVDFPGVVAALEKTTSGEGE